MLLFLLFCLLFSSIILVYAQNIFIVLIKIKQIVDIVILIHMVQLYPIVVIFQQLIICYVLINQVNHYEKRLVFFFSTPLFLFVDFVLVCIIFLRKKKVGQFNLSTFIMLTFLNLLVVFSSMYHTSIIYSVGNKEQLFFFDYPLLISHR